MIPKFNFVVCSIEESKDIDSLSIDELQSSLLVHEKNVVQQDKEEQALNEVANPKGISSGKPRRKDKNEHHKSDEDHTTDSNWREKGRDSNHSKDYKPKSGDKSKIECYRCHRYDHYKS